MRMPSGRVWIMFLLVGGATAANFAFHRGRSGEKGPVNISTFPLGTALPELKLQMLSGAQAGPAAAPVPTGCRLLVMFSSSCPHCHTAAIMETGIPDSVRLPVLWISDRDDPQALAFASRLHPASVVRHGGGDAFRALQVRGVPAVFLVSGDGRVLASASYSGGESDHRVLRGKCPR